MAGIYFEQFSVGQTFVRDQAQVTDMNASLFSR
jgi:hypothetical protein